MRRTKDLSRVDIGVCVGLLLLGCTLPLLGQQPVAVSSTRDNAIVPPLVSFSGVLTDLSGKPISGVTGVTFALYKDEQGGAPLWLETQNVYPDKTGHYTVLLGSTRSTGLPADLFVTGEPRWLGVQVQGREEQPRTSLTSAPYALKAGDAQTVGGLPASAFVLAAPPVASSGTVANSAATTPASVQPATTSNVTTTGGTANTIPMFTTATNIQNSILTQTGTTAINVGGKLNLPATGTATASTGYNSRPQDFVASVYNSSTSTAVPQTFQWQAEPVNNDKSTASGTLNLLYATGTATPAETGVSVNSGGGLTTHGLILPAIGTASNASTGGFTSRPLDLFASSWDTYGTAAAVSQHFRWQAEPAGSDTVSPSGTLNLLYASGTAAPAETTLKISSKGLFTFATGQTFPGTGTITGITTATGSGLSGGGTSGTLSLKLLGTCSTNQILKWSGTAWACAADANSGGTVTSIATGLGLTGGPITKTGTLAIDTTVVPQLSVNNTFTGQQSFTGGYGWFKDQLYVEPYLDVYGAGNAIAISGYSDTTSASTPTLYLENDDTTNAGDWVFDAVGPGFSGQCTIDVSGNLFCTGPLLSVASTPGNRKVGLYTVQSSENWVEDFGSGRLSAGVATVQIEPGFGQAVTAANYHVFLTPGGDCQGLYVTNRTATSFEVRELNGGKSSVEFDYRIVAHRRGYEAVRLPDFASKLAGRVARPAAPDTHQAKVVGRK